LQVAELITPLQLKSLKHLRMQPVFLLLKLLVEKAEFKTQGIGI
jgi:hypothetical protein